MNEKDQMFVFKGPTDNPDSKMMPTRKTIYALVFCLLSFEEELMESYLKFTRETKAREM